MANVVIAMYRLDRYNNNIIIIISEPLKHLQLHRCFAQSNAPSLPHCCQRCIQTHQAWHPTPPGRGCVSLEHDLNNQHRLTTTALRFSHINRNTSRSSIETIKDSNNNCFQLSFQWLMFLNALKELLGIAGAQLFIGETSFLFSNQLHQNTEWLVN